MKKFVFFLGGHDLEMQTISTLVEQHLGADAVRDKGLGWGARLSEYGPQLRHLSPSQVPVLVELTLDAPVPERAVIVDHHGPAIAPHTPTSLEQVFHLLDLPAEHWTRHLALVAANDRGHRAAMRKIGATPEEISAIRAADRRAQGITEDEERQGVDALAAAEKRLNGTLTLVRLPHGRTATVMDRIDEDMAEVLILSPDEVNFFGRGVAVQALQSAFPDGWCGGDLPTAGFWGHGNPLPSEAALLQILNNLCR